LGRGASFDPRADPIVRAEASRLRGRLERYYLTDGRSDTIEILLPRGGYIPRFDVRAAEATAPRLRPAPAVRSDKTRWLWLGAGLLFGILIGMTLSGLRLYSQWR